jgi:hypothetical protein
MNVILRSEATKNLKCLPETLYHPFRDLLGWNVMGG